jgi:hypothetical protein
MYSLATLSQQACVIKFFVLPACLAGFFSRIETGITTFEKANQNQSKEATNSLLLYRKQQDTTKKQRKFCAMRYSCIALVHYRSLLKGLLSCERKPIGDSMDAFLFWTIIEAYKRGFSAVKGNQFIGVLSFWTIIEAY